ncbi:MAG: metalloregulator ArsR/SmtB family transcription factor [Phycisphaerales bacterium]
MPATQVEPTAEEGAPDVFVALGDPRRRRLMELLGERGESPVTDLVDALAIAQPSVSKHLGVLRAAGLVAVRRRGRERLYSVRAEQVRAVMEWTMRFERLWSHQIDRVKARAEAMARDDTPRPRPNRSTPTDAASTRTPTAPNDAVGRQENTP